MSRSTRGKAEQSRASKAKRPPRKPRADGAVSGSGPSRAPRGRASRDQELSLILESAAANLVDVDQPLVVVSQLPRSGGALLIRLLDDHPECHVLPLPFQLGSARDLQGLLAVRDGRYLDPGFGSLLRHGYQQPKGKLHGDRRSYPLVVPPGIFRSLFERLVASRKPSTSRDVLDCYATAFFNSWLDNRNLRSDSEKRWTIARVPHTGGPKLSLDSFNSAYPDGRLISVLRDPWTWYASACRWGTRWVDLERAMKAWGRAAEAFGLWKTELGRRMKVIAFEDLIIDTDKSAHSLARFLGVRHLPSMHRPTLNGIPVEPASSFPAAGGEISTGPLTRHLECLGEDQIETIERRAGKLYRDVRQLARVPKGGLSKEPGPGGDSSPAPASP